MTQSFWSVIRKIVSELDAASIAYCFLNESALWMQGVDVAVESLDVSIQWDVFQTAHERFVALGASEIEKAKGMDKFSVVLDGVAVNILCYYNTVVETDPDRVPVEQGGLTAYAKSLDFYKRVWGKEDPRRQAITAHLRQLQKSHSEISERAWNQDTYTAWFERYGTPEEAAAYILKDPAARLNPLYRHMGDLQGKKVINLLGSHGMKAVAMTLLGADATVVDISPENARYANEVAEAAGVKIRYVVSDVLELPQEERDGSYDVVLMELGILHYFVDLEPLFELVRELLAPGGQLLLQDFHPISTKLITSKGKKHKVDGNYFDKTLEVRDVAYSKHFSDTRELEKVYLRKWTLGEVVTAVAQAGLFLRVLEEEPNTKLHDMGLPKTFTVVAERV